MHWVTVLLAWVLYVSGLSNEYHCTSTQDLIQGFEHTYVGYFRYTTHILYVLIYNLTSNTIELGV